MGHGLNAFFTIQLSLTLFLSLKLYIKIAQPLDDMILKFVRLNWGSPFATLVIVTSKLNMFQMREPSRGFMYVIILFREHRSSATVNRGRIRDGLVAKWVLHTMAFLLPRRK